MPKLELDWEMGVFRALRALLRAVRPAPPPDHDPEIAAVLAGSEERWKWVASLIRGRPCRVECARDHGGVRGGVLLLPKAIALVEDREVNEALYLLRVAVDAAVSRAPPAVAPDDAARTALHLHEVGHAVQALTDELAAFGPAFREAAAWVRSTRSTDTLGPRGALEELAIRAVLDGALPPGDLAERLRAAREGGGRPDPVPLWGRRIPLDPGEAHDGDPSEPQQPPSRDGTEHRAPAFEEIEVVQLSDEGITEMPIHAFEKVEMAEAFNGTFRQLDGEDELNDHLESLDEVDLGTLLRGGPQAHSVLQADISLGAEVPDVDTIGADEVGLAYDEWDASRSRYRPGWCQVYPAALPPGGDDTWAREAAHRHRRQIEALYDRLLAHRTERSLRRRQLDGDDLDLDAVITAQGDLRSGRTPSARLYETRRSVSRDVATTVLLDVSLSSDSWIDGQRVLDVSREALLVLGEVADRLGDRLQILAFASSTRHRIRVFRVHDWHEPWALGRRALGRLAPQGYTRLGAAIRHATTEITGVTARNRVLLLITDGKPTDWDRYEGHYGVADVRMALREARSQRVAVHALAVDAVARDYLPQMLGHGAWDILRHPRDLPDALTRVYGRLS